MRRLRPLLPEQAAGGGHRPHLSTPTSAASCWTARPAAAPTTPTARAKVKDCVTLTPAQHQPHLWLPPTCGYRLVADGKDLYWWHPLVSGDPDTVHQAGVSVRGKVGASEVDVPDKDLEDHIVSWPLKWPKGAKDKGRRRR